MLTQSKLTVTKPSDLEFQLTRTVSAPRELVFKAWTTPEHVKRWYGCRDTALVVCEIDLRVGGTWRYVSRTSDGNEFPMTGVYQEILPPERLVYTEIFDVEPYRNFPALNTVTFVENEGKTTITSVIRHQTKEARDGHLNSGVEYGASQTFDRLEELLLELQGFAST